MNKSYRYLSFLTFFVCLSFFSCGISAHAGQKERPIKLSKLQKVRSQVWSEWCKRLAEEDTLARFSMQPLADALVCRWDLPAILEPSATMNFYSGTKGERPQAGYPLFLYLHGSGPREMEWNTGLRLGLNFEDAPSMYVIPQIPNEGQYYRWWQQSKQWAWNRLLRQVLANPDVDPSRLYLFGISEGGYGSQRLASFYADYLAAAAPMAGGEPLRNAPAENLSNTAFSLVTGERDAMFYRNILTARTKQRLDSLERVFPDEFVHRVYLEKDKGHAITYGVSPTWLKGFTRKAQPTHFLWENYEMDGVKRNCFYNLQVLSESSAERSSYEFRIENNVIHLDVSDVEYIITERDPNWGIELNNTRRYVPAQHGCVRIFLSEQLADLTKPVTLYVNGVLKGSYTLRPLAVTLRQSCELFGDPLRLFPVAVNVEW